MIEKIIWNMDFAQNIIAELFGVALEVIIIFKIVSYYNDKKHKINYTSVISPMINNFASSHAKIKETIEAFQVLDDYPLKFKSWVNEIENQISELCSHNLYVYYPDLNKQLIEYKHTLNKFYACFTSGLYETGIFDNIQNKYKLIYKTLQDDSLLSKQDYWKTEDLIEIEQKLQDSSWEIE